jgi:hypothetical protein
VGRPAILVLIMAALALTGALGVAFLRGELGGRLDPDRRTSTEEPVARDVPARPAPEPEGPAGRSAQAWTVFGEVRDRGGRPVPGALVEAASLRNREATKTATSADGVYELRMPGPACVLGVRATGYLPLSGEQVIVDRPGATRRDFVLEPAAVLLGRVVDESLTPVRAARVYVISAEHVLLDRPDAGNTVLTDGSGEFTFPGLPEGSFDLGVRHRRYLPALERDVAIPASGTLRRTVILRPGRRVVATVRNATENTVVLASDSALREMLLPPGGIQALADGLVGRQFAELPVVRREIVEITEDPAAGECVLEGLPPGPVDIVALDPGRLAEPGRGSLLDSLSPSVELELLAFAVARLDIHDAVTRAPLEPVITRTCGEEERLALHPREGGWAVPEDGRLHTLHFELAGYEEAHLALPPDPATWPEVFEVALLPAAGGEVGSFRVVFDPPGRGRLAAVGRDGSGRTVWTKHVDRPDGEDRWVLSGVPVGEYSVSLLLSGTVPVTLPRVVVVPGLVETYRVAAVPGGGLEIKVVDADGELLDKVHLVLEDAAGNRIDIHVLTHVSEGKGFLSINYLPSAASAKADSGLAAGAYSLTVYREGYLPATRDFVVAGTEVAEVELSLTPR